PARIRAEVSGTVRDRQGREIKGARLRVFDEEGVVLAIGITDRNGEFTFEIPLSQNDSPRRYEVEANYKNLHDVETFSLGTMPQFRYVMLRLKLKPGIVTGSDSELNGVVIKVFYATDRRLSSTPGEFYSGHRDNGDGLHLGTCDVHLPRDHKLGRLELPQIWKLEFKPNPRKHVMVQDVKPESESDFSAELRKDVSASTHKQVLVFVHGYDNTFPDAVRRTAQIAYDLHFDGPTIAYSWPSRGVSWAYSADESTAEWTAPHFRRFLELLATNSPGGSIHIISHSMGTRPVAAALEQLAKVPSKVRFQQVILAAPDIDSEVLRQIGVAMSKVAGRITLYASSSDRMLQLSESLHSYARAGSSGKNIFIMHGIDTVDASAVDTTLIGHTYYADERSIISDIFALIRHGD